jgi:hypothetical protein
MIPWLCPIALDRDVVRMLANGGNNGNIVVIRNNLPNGGLCSSNGLQDVGVERASTLIIFDNNK